MNYKVKFVYNDGKDLDVILKPDELDTFFKSLNGKQLFWNEFQTVGFWTDLDKIRYVQVFSNQQKAVETHENSGSEDTSGLPEAACDPATAEICAAIG